MAAAQHQQRERMQQRAILAQQALMDRRAMHDLRRMNVQGRFNQVARDQEHEFRFQQQALDNAARQGLLNQQLDDRADADVFAANVALDKDRRAQKNAQDNALLAGDIGFVANREEVINNLLEGGASFTPEQERHNDGIRAQQRSVMNNDRLSAKSKMLRYKQLEEDLELPQVPPPPPLSEQLKSDTAFYNDDPSLGAWARKPDGGYDLLRPNQQDDPAKLQWEQEKAQQEIQQKMIQMRFDMMMKQMDMQMKAWVEAQKQAIASLTTKDVDGNVQVPDAAKVGTRTAEYLRSLESSMPKMAPMGDGSDQPLRIGESSQLRRGEQLKRGDTRVYRKADGYWYIGVWDGTEFDDATERLAKPSEM
jgi:hypothetical protein